MPSCKPSCKFVQGKTKARERIEDFVLSQNALLKPNKQGWEYTLTNSYRTDGKLDTIIYDILQASDSIADVQYCFIEADVRALDDSERSW